MSLGGLRSGRNESDGGELQGKGGREIFGGGKEGGNCDQDVRNERKHF